MKIPRKFSASLVTRTVLLVLAAVMIADDPASPSRFGIVLE